MSRFADFKMHFWNPQTKKCLGRTGESWLKIIGFYIALYSCLAAIWSIYFYIFHLTISDKYPKWQLEESLIGTNPGVGLRPQSPRKRVESALISFREGPDGDYEHWVNDLSSFLEQSDPGRLNGSSGEPRPASEQRLQLAKQDCNPNKEPSDTESYCPFDSSSIPVECTAAQNYSFAEGRPCLLIKLNRIYGWRPQPYLERPAKYPAGAPFTPGNIQITCDGQHDPDKEHVGPVEYFPAGGIETKYYPFLNQPGYQSPYVMVHFKEPKRNTLIYVECKAWAKNVDHDRYNKKGMVAFELFVERAVGSKSE